MERLCDNFNRLWQQEAVEPLLLKELRAEGQIEAVGRGRGAKWKRTG
jgi:hypothetical protein